MNKEWKCTADLPARNRKRLVPYLKALMGLFLLGGRRTFPYAAIGTFNE
ncbi:hypothetical protein [Paenibacillus sp. S28]|nr:hypothetical protein [Paenibacillus sp. S28]MBJ9989036.1 hypothetical protein [Paenibacillus sp. S28]